MDTRSTNNLSHYLHGFLRRDAVPNIWLRVKLYGSKFSSEDFAPMARRLLQVVAANRSPVGILTDASLAEAMNDQEACGVVVGVRRGRCLFEMLVAYRVASEALTKGTQWPVRIHSYDDRLSRAHATHGVIVDLERWLTEVETWIGKKNPAIYSTKSSFRPSGLGTVYGGGVHWGAMRPKNSGVTIEMIREELERRDEARRPNLPTPPRESNRPSSLLH